MSHKKLSPFIVKVSVLGYFPLRYIIQYTTYIVHVHCIIHQMLYTLLYIRMCNLYGRYSLTHTEGALGHIWTYHPVGHSLYN